MGVGKWFKALISPKKAKENRSKQLTKVHSRTTEKSNGCKWWKYGSRKGSNRSANVDPNGHLSDHRKRIEDLAATRIQNAFRSYLARKALINRLKGSVKFQVSIKDQTVRKQVSAALDHLHTWSRIQAEIRDRRHYMVTEGRLRQKKMQNQLKLEAKLQELEVEWCGGPETMEEILSRIQQREEAAVKRERTLAYAFSHQWRANASQYLGHPCYVAGDLNWGWSWMDRWIAARPWESRVQAQHNNPKKVQAKVASVAIKPAVTNPKGASAKLQKIVPQATQ